MGQEFLELFLEQAGGFGWMPVLQVASRSLLCRWRKLPCATCLLSLIAMTAGCECCPLKCTIHCALIYLMRHVGMQYLPGLVATLALIMTNCIQR